MTGGAGYIGSHACKALFDAGYLPITYDSLVSGHEWAVKWGPLERGDIADRERLGQVLLRYKPVAAMHFAAHIAAGESVTDPGKYYGNNVAGTLSLLEALRAAGMSRLVYSSTAAVYGTPNTVPIPETHPLCPINPYGRSKLMIEQALADYASAYDFRVTALRYFNVAGADHAAGIGEVHDPETHLIPLLLAAVDGRSTSLTIYGDDYPTADGTCIRDYIHVTDLAEAHVLALDRASDAERFATFNLGGGEGRSVRQVIRAAEQLAGRKVPHSIGPRRTGDPSALVSDIARASSVLGWKPTRSSLERQIGDAWAWHRQHFG
ncbi:MAG: UDP-glucose 4-epimerase GalE [Kiloniellales bacterium]